MSRSTLAVEWIRLRRELGDLWALLPIGGLLAVFWARHVGPWSWLEPESDHFETLFLVALAIGVLLGYGQLQLERWRGSTVDQALRDGGARSWLRSKRLAGMTAGVVIVYAPIACAYLWQRNGAGCSEVALWPRLLELFGVTLWMAPAYFFSQWQALSHAGRPGESVRLALAILLGGAPYATLAALDKRWLGPGQGFWVLLGSCVVLTLFSRWLADRAAKNLPFRLRIGSPRVTAWGAGSVAVSALLLIALVQRQAGTFLTRDSSESAPYVMYDDAGHVALGHRVSGVLMVNAIEGAPFPTDPGASRWYTMRAASSDYVPTRSATRVAGTLTDFVRLGTVHGGHETRHDSAQVLVLQPQGRVVLQSLNGLSSPERRRFSVRLVRDLEGSPLRVGARIATQQHRDAPDLADRRNLAVFDLDGKKAHLVRANGGARPFDVSEGDSIHAVRHEVTPRSDGKDDDTHVVWIGSRGEYVWSDRTRSFVEFEDTTPPPPTYRALDPRGRRVEVAGTTIERWSSGFAYTVDADAARTLALIVRAPLESAVNEVRDLFFEAPPRSTANRQSFLPFARLAYVPWWARALHLIVGGALGGLTWRRLRGHPTRRAWALFVAATGVVGAAACIVETSLMRVRAEDGRWRLRATR